MPADVGRLAIPFEERRLGNRLRVIVSRDDSAPVVTVALYYNVGFRLEPRGRTGFAHLFEHLMFQGSEQLAKLEFIRLVQQTGGVLNGSTRPDFTNYFEMLPAHALELALWMEADRMRGPVITQAELDNQRDIVKNEIKVNVLNRPYGGFPWIDLGERAYRNWANAHNGYGDMQDLDAATIEDVRDFFARYYAPANAVLAIVGDVDPDGALMLAERHFAAIPSAPAPEPPDIAEPRREREERFRKADPLAHLPALALGYHAPERGTPEFYALGLLDQALLQGDDALLRRALVHERGLTDELHGGLNLLGHMHNGRTPMLWAPWCIHAPDASEDTVLSAIDEVIERVRERPLPAADFERARLKARSALYESLSGGMFPGLGRADLLASFALFDGDPAGALAIEARFEELTPELVLATAQEYLRPSNRAVLALGRRGGSRRRRRGRRGGRCLVSGAPRPAVGRPPAWRLPPRKRVQLAGGLGVTMVQVGAAPKATLQLVTGAGSALEGPGQTWLARLVARYLKEGTVRRDSAALADHVAGLGGELEVDADDDTLTLEARVLSEFAPQAAELLAEVVRTPALPEEALPRLRADLGRQLELARSEPGWLTLARFREALYGDHPYGRVLAHEAEIEGLSLPEARVFLDLGVGAAGSRLYVAGRFDAEAVGAAAARALGDWDSPAGLEAPPPEPFSERVIHLVDRPGAAQSTIDLGLPVPGPTHEDFVPLMVADALRGGSFMSRITSNIREQKGYTYSPRSTVSARRGGTYWLETADVTTAVTGASLTEIFGEIERLRAEPPPAEELAGIQNYVAGVQLMRGATAPCLIGVLSFLDLHGLDEAWAQSFVERVYAVTPAELQRVVVLHLRPDEMTIAVAGDAREIEEQLAPFGRIERDPEAEQA